MKVGSPRRKDLLEARDEFRALLEVSGTSESKFQKLFEKHPFILSNALPLSLTPLDIHPGGRPGKAEVDFLIYPHAARRAHFYGAIEIKRPDTKILKQPRKSIVTLTSDVNTAVAQATKYARELGRELEQRDRPLVAMGNDEYLFLILGRQAELTAKVTSSDLRHQFNALLPANCRLFPYDTILGAFEDNIPRVACLLVPGAPQYSAFNRRIPPVTNEVFWQLCALECAQHAHEMNFSSRRGTYPYIVTEEGEAAFCIYNNNPYSGNPQLRDEETARIRQWLSRNDLVELAYAVYPETGEDQGYTYAILVDVAEGDIEEQSRIRAALLEITNESYDQMDREEDGAISEGCLPK